MSAPANRRVTAGLDVTPVACGTVWHSGTTVLARAWIVAECPSCQTRDVQPYCADCARRNYIDLRRHAWAGGLIGCDDCHVAAPLARWSIVTHPVAVTA